MKINQGRWTAEIEGDFVVFIIGARVNSKWQLFRSLIDLGGRNGMNKMLRYLTEHPEKGLLGYETMGFANVQYWRSFDHLETFARDKDDPHLEPWRAFWRRVAKTGRTGIWHETYLVRAGEYEAVYGNMPTRGLAKASKVVPLAESIGARQRLKTAAATTRPRQGISIFRAEDATPLVETDFMGMPQMSSEALAAGGPEIFMASAPGTDVRVAVRQTPEEGGFSILHVWFKADYPVPRHTHDADCMYYIVSGSAILGSQTLRPGDGFFIPTGAPYGYSAGPDGVELLEIRHDVAQFDIQLLESNAGKWAAMADTIASHRDAWEADTISPTLAANRAGATAT